MSSYPYLGTYGLTTTDNITFTMAFSIPSNCNYASSGSAGVYWITINLNPGETQPSTVFAMEQENYACVNNSLTVSFDQPTTGGRRLKKPVASVNE
ncbi:MAG: hypothetical protein EOO50_04705 [Flavobacterium sp.]|uniref:hypothetical protein n=1 Tax=Flavobacterium sp. TaxID=239 RepID=UPI00120CD5EB|nr:hypothetical protein [Flavobacterium sp.]RZJ67584.1 MAG: hypothetical protein EOO50_04705 [Flavobacterium sp.]